MIYIDLPIHHGHGDHGDRLSTLERDYFPIWDGD
jgi:hypothetical protein